MTSAGDEAFSLGSEHQYEEDLETTLFKRSCELFNACDVEKKGYLSKQDMPRLEQKLGLELPPDQLNLVFDTLDKDGDGFLTLEEFSEGFGSYLGVTNVGALDDTTDLSTGALNSQYDLERSDDVTNHVTLQDEHVYTNDHSLNATNDEEHFQNLVQQMGVKGVIEDLEGVRLLWGQLKQGPPELLNNFEDFLHRVTGEMKKSQREYKSLESILRSKSLSHDEEVKRLYEEMETQITAEKQRVRAEERAREKQVKESLERELLEKDKQLLDLITNHQKMEEKLRELNTQDSESKQEKERLEKEKNDMEEILEDSRRSLEESRAYITQLRNQQKEEKRERALAALHVSEGIALERESLVKQLDLLKDMNRRLRDDKDEEELRQSCGSLQDLTTHDVEGGKLPRASSVQTSGYPRGGMSAQNSFSSLSGPAGLRPASSMDGAPPPEGERSNFVEQDLLHRRAQFLKRGSVLSNYINTDPVWSMPTYESDVDVEECEGEYDDESLPDLSRSPRPRRPLPPHHAYRSRGGEEDDMGVCSGEESEIDQVDSRRLKSSRKPRRQGATDVEDRLTGQREQPVGANSPSECGDLTRSASEIENAPPERVFKVVFVGDSAVGKSSFIHRFCNNTFRIAFQATIGVDFQVKNLWVDRHIIALQLWDTAGQERFRSITKQYFRKADGVILMYDITNETSFKNIRNWLTSVQEGTEEGTVLVLAGNKLDLLLEDEGNRAVPTADGMRLADEFGSLFFETSAKSGAHIPETVEAMARLLNVIVKVKEFSNPEDSKGLLREKEDKEMEKALRLSEAEARKKSCCKK